MSRLSGTPVAATAVLVPGLVAPSYPSSASVASMSIAIVPEAHCTTAWGFAGATTKGFAVANTKRSPQRLEESLT